MKKTKEYVITNEYADRIRVARVNAGLTQKQLSDNLGVSYQAISSWEQPTGYVPDTKHLIELAKVCKVSVSSLVEDRGDYSFETTETIYKWDSMRRHIQTVANTLDLTNTLNAIDFALKVHKGQTRKNSDVPYIYHPLNLACHLLAMNIKEDDIIAASLLHDVVEDCGVKLEDLPVDDETKRLVDFLTHKTQPNKEDEFKQYIKKIESNPKACLIKLVDRCNNLTTMSWGFSRQKIYEYIEETEKYIIPLLSKIKNTKYDNAKWLLSYQIKTTLDIYKRLM